MKLKTLDDSLILDRKDQINRAYITNCAALSFHKAIIGVTELKALEELSSNSIAGGFRISRAINTYYIVYHLFCSLMLMDKYYEIKVKNYNKVDGYINFYVNSNNLNDEKELPDTWNNCRYYERDLSTLIVHEDIKDYCKKLRKNPPSNSDEYNILYQNFIYADLNKPYVSIKGLYEKICYIRDRTIYRPSVVYDHKNNKYQTSLDVRKEIDNLPNSNELFNVIQNIYINIKAKEEHDEYAYSFLFNFWYDLIDDDEEYLLSLGFSKNDIQNLTHIINGDVVIRVNSFLSQYIEIADKERVFIDLDRFWDTLKSLH